MEDPEFALRLNFSNTRAVQSTLDTGFTYAYLQQVDIGMPLCVMNMFKIICLILHNMRSSYPMHGYNKIQYHNLHNSKPLNRFKPDANFSLEMTVTQH